MLVVVEAQAKIQAADARKRRIESGFGVDTRLRQVQDRVALFFFLAALFFFIVLVLVPVSTGQSVVCFIGRYGDAKETAIADVRHADRTTTRFQLAAGQRSKRFFFALFFLFAFQFLECAQGGRFRKTRDVVFVGIAIESVEVQRKATCAGLDAGCSGSLIGVVGRADFRLRRQLLRHCVRNTPGVHVDDATNCAAAVEQRAGPLEHFDALGDERLDGCQVIRARYRDIHAVDSVFHRLDTGAAQATYHGAAYRMTEA